MEETSSSRMALRNLLKESKEKRIEPKIEAKAFQVQPNSASVMVSEEKRKEQLRLGKMIFEFFEEKPSVSEEPPKIRSKGRPKKLKTEKAKNITVCLSKKHIELLDGLSLSQKNVRGRGTKVKSILEDWMKYKKREKEQVKILQDGLAQVAKHLETFSNQYKRAEKYQENERTISDLEKAISNFKIIFSMLKIEVKDLRKLLTNQEITHFEFCLNWISNRSGQQ
jgi:hypothetical protein